MDTNKIRTSHDLADILEDAVRVLRMLPDMQLSKLDQNSDSSSILSHSTTGPNEENDQGCIKDDLTRLADQFNELGREKAENEISALTVPAIREVASLLQIRIPSRATKADSINMILSQVFDVPAGQELIRTFHKRNSQIPASKSFAKPGQFRRK